MNENKIKVLPENLINKIAAGEVIDRPSSVVKELIENSIDAGADRITVIIKDGGKELIQVIDNGCGMNEQDAIMSFQRHATSKIASYRDVGRISTLGFRGEALASIASVSRVELKTVPRNSIEGTLMIIEGGTVQRVEHTGGNPGTSLAVKNIFYNTPARRKFLRAGSTEYRHILAMLNRFTLANPDIGFALVNEGNEIFNLKPAPLKERIGQVLGSRVGDNLIKVNDDTAVMKITGFVGNFDVLRKSRNDQYLFVNKRYVNDRTISAALFAAFGESIPKGTFPLYILFFEIDPERVDVNVHPTKSEVKFADQQMMYSLVRGAVKRALITDNIIPEMQQNRSASPTHFDQRFGSSIVDDMRHFSAERGRMNFETQQKETQQSLPLTIEPSPDASPFPVPSPEPPAQTRQSDGAIVWQLHNKYILSQIKSGLVVIDQHVAHERILYEKAKASFKAKNIPSQQLLFPQTIDLSSEDYEALMEILPFLEKIGFILKGFGGKTVVVEGVPSGMRIRGENKILLDILDEYRTNQGTEIDIQERVAKSFSCRSAIMAGDRLTPEAMNALIDQLFTTQNPYFCPHGRPVMITISIDELDKRFDRK